MSEFERDPVIVARRYHDFSCGHRVVGHEGACALLHGHNYRVTFTVRARQRLDAVSRVLDFSVIKKLLCNWLEENWDHRFLAWDRDPDIVPMLAQINFTSLLERSIVLVPFNPTAERMALHLLQIVGPEQLKATDCDLIHVNVEETRKCRAEAYL